MKKSSTRWMAATSAVLAAGATIALISSGKKSRITKYVHKPFNQERLTFAKKKLELHKDRIQKRLARINAKLTFQENNAVNL